MSSNGQLDAGPLVAPRSVAGEGLAARLAHGYSWLCRRLALGCMALGVTGLVVLIACVLYQVFGRYVLNNTPTWAESLALVVVLYVTMFGTAVGVRDAGHIGMESLLVLVNERIRHVLEIVIHLLVLLFGIVMAWNCSILVGSVWTYTLPTLGISEGWRYVPTVIAGMLIAMFSLEHIVALLRGTEVEPTWA
jgi:TRAP-type C4-dicarboxylate transport system permease small subunit